MVSLLVINSSPRYEECSFSRYVTKKISEQLVARGVEEVNATDLAVDLPPLIDASWISASCETCSTPSQTVLSYSNKVIQAWAQADIIVLGTPMHNFGPPAALKAYMDQLVRYNVTFTSTSASTSPKRCIHLDEPSSTPDLLAETDKEEVWDRHVKPFRGLLSSNKCVILAICTSWSFHGSSVLAVYDNLTPWLLNVLELIGIQRVHTILADELDEVEAGLKSKEVKLTEIMIEVDRIVTKVITELNKDDRTSKNA